MVRKLMVLLPLLVACQHSPPCQFALDPGFSEEERLAFQQAGDEWRKVTGNRADATFDGQWMDPALGDHLIYRAKPGELGGKGGETYWHQFPATARQPDHMVIDPSQVDAKHLRWTVAHELLHHWGFEGHSDNPEDLMYHSSAERISANDVAAFCGLHGGC